MYLILIIATQYTKTVFLFDTGERVGSSELLDLHPAIYVHWSKAAALQIFQLETTTYFIQCEVNKNQ